MKHTLSVTVANEAGVLVRIAGLFSRRGFNINSLAVGKTESDDISRITLVVEGTDETLEQVVKQLNKLIVVHKISDLTNVSAIDRGLALIKVKADIDDRSEVMQIVNTFRGKVVDVAQDSVTIEITGEKEKINALEDLLRPFGILELVRTGQIALARGKK
ncbi:acetolactate synthase small subunit [Acetohalobium arabaticum]|uniref:Acetolactate synthase small subunit n=1 Tax=Acetohalobium arabaticum (strain ATCC 49924 / DSM 5501 / Z-7288) TaxID=574087 RepID=D9QVC0_ACEAZ|nr:acetolactate synthase small subunit [Acetohalobium arabaticum]ADL12179.1 acetolactate synthase, small subunit [Acetohalobium arabaticum DSM 5501]